MAIFKPIDMSIYKFKHVIKKRTGIDVNKFINNGIIYYYINQYDVWIMFINDFNMCALLSNSDDILKCVCEGLDVRKINYKRENIKTHIIKYYRDLYNNNPLYIPI